MTVFTALLPAAAQDFFVYVGTYTNTDSKGIYVYRFNSATGDIAPVGVAAELTNPSFLAIHPNGKLMYAVNEVGTYAGQKTGSITSFSIDKASGKLAKLGTVSSGGNGPCFVSVDKSGKCVMAANYGGGSFSAFPIKADGSLGDAVAFIQDTGSGPNPKRQKEPHAHSINVSPDNRYAFAADLGLDKVFIFKLDPAKATLTANDPAFAALPPGSGPRHLAFHPSGKFVFVINELLSTMTSFSYDAAKGSMKEIETVSTLPKDFTGNNSTAEVQAHPSGKFVYGSNRGHDSIAVFSVDTGRGTLKLIENVPTQGKTPRNFTIDPTGKFIFAANQDSGNVVIFRIDQRTGKLTPTGKQLEVSRPVCVKFLAIK
jgi:6-phosphogluconolactonase